MIGCPVCFQPCEDLPAHEGGREVVCRSCGHFRVDAGLHARLKSHMFLYREASRRLEERRRHAAVPVLGLGDVDLLQSR